MQIEKWEQTGMSWQTVGGRLMAALGRPRTAKMVNATAVAVFAVLLAHWTWGFIAPPRPQRAAPTEVGRVRALPLSVLLKSDIFGRSATTSLAAIPVSHLALTLSGLVMGNPAVALIGQPGSGVRPYLVGATISSGVVLDAVTADRAIVRQNGRLESLLLYPAQLNALVASSSSQASAPPSPLPRGPSRPGGAVTVPVSSATMSQLSDVSTAQLHSWLAPGAEGGVLVKGAPGGALAGLGLRPGDIIEEINGRPVNSLASAISAYMAGAKAGSVTADVAHGGHIKVFDYRLQGQ